MTEKNAFITATVKVVCFPLTCAGVMCDSFELFFFLGQKQYKDTPSSKNTTICEQYL